MDNSFWIQTRMKDREEHKKLRRSIETEVCIIGGGLTGLTTAYYLSKQGVDVVLLEKNKICSHTSGNTTAKITSQHGLIYKYLIDSQGKESAKQYLDANEEAIRNIEKIINEEQIDCDFEKQDAYIFTQKPEELEKIKLEIKALEQLEYEAEFVDKIELPIEILGAIKFKNQAQFNPCKYALGLEKSIKGKIYENTKVVGLEGRGSKYIVSTEEGKVKAKYVVIATHYPIINAPGYYFMKMYQETSYLIAVDTQEKFSGMYINSEEPTLSFRMADNMVLVGGMSHKTGAKIDLEDSYKYLEDTTKKLFPDCNVQYRWNTEDCVSLDKIPYIGEFSTLMPNIYVGTGYKKWGMTSSNVAAKIISNKILGIENENAEVFASTRLKPLKNYKELSNMIKETSYSLVINKLKEAPDHLKDVKMGEGKIIEIEGKKVGVYQDEEGNIHAIKPVCSHLGCELSWNNLDKTWDCPCHGSRFNYDGKALYDPAIKDLEKLNKG